MSGSQEFAAIQFARANERLRQEAATFEERKLQSRLWFALRMGVGISAIVALMVILVVSAYVLLSNEKYPAPVYYAAIIGLLGDILAITLIVFKVILAPETNSTLAPVTDG